MPGLRVKKESYTPFEPIRLSEVQRNIGAKLYYNGIVGQN